jgi:hypothetical protein
MHLILFTYLLIFSFSKFSVNYMYYDFHHISWLAFLLLMPTYLNTYISSTSMLLLI